MKQVVFAIALIAMASLTGCLNTDDTSVDENTDTTSDTTQDDRLIEPVGVTGYTPPETANITVYTDEDDEIWNKWVAKNGNKLTSACMSSSSRNVNTFKVYDNDMTLIFVANNPTDYGVEACNIGTVFNGYKLNVELGPEPARIGFTGDSYYQTTLNTEDYVMIPLDTGEKWQWFVSF